MHDRANSKDPRPTWPIPTAARPKNVDAQSKRFEELGARFEAARIEVRDLTKTGVEAARRLDREALAAAISAGKSLAAKEDGRHEREAQERLEARTREYQALRDVVDEEGNKLADLIVSERSAWLADLVAERERARDHAIELLEEVVSELEAAGFAESAIGWLQELDRGLAYSGRARGWNGKPTRQLVRLDFSAADIAANDAVAIVGKFIDGLKPAPPAPPNLETTGFPQVDAAAVSRKKVDVVFFS